MHIFILIASIHRLALLYCADVWITHADGKSYGTLARGEYYHRFSILSQIWSFLSRKSISKCRDCMAWVLIEAMHHVCIVLHALLLQLLLTFILCWHFCGRSASAIASAFVWFNTGIYVYDWSGSPMVWYGPCLESWQHMCFYARCFQRHGCCDDDYCILTLVPLVLLLCRNHVWYVT